MMHAIRGEPCVPFFVDYLMNTLPSPGVATAVPQHLRGRTICRDSGVYVQDADDLILRFDLYQLARTKSEHRSWAVCNLPSMNGNRAHLASTAALAQATEDTAASALSGRFAEAP